jgi:hypothetical protein
LPLFTEQNPGLQLGGSLEQIPLFTGSFPLFNESYKEAPALSVESVARPTTQGGDGLSLAGLTVRRNREWAWLALPEH